MGRSSKELAGDNHQRIVAAAGRLFRSRGYDAVGIADVMKAAGMTQGGFYKHFASKEALACEAWGAGFKGAAALWRQQDGGSSPVAAVVDYYLAPKPPEYRCPMLAHGEEAARMEEGSEPRGVYAEGARSLYETFMEAAKGSMDEDKARLLFAAMVGANMLSRAAGDAQWVVALKKSVKDAAAQSPTAGIISENLNRPR
jgi:TetR/AcrR family transcriptional regulator, transcriptional repressor for nem operon